MSSVFIDYSIGLGVLLMSFAVVVGFVSGAGTDVERNIQTSTMQLNAMSLLGLSERGYIFDTSISGFGLAKYISNASDQSGKIVLSSEAMQRLESADYNGINEGIDFRMRVLDSANNTAFSYGPSPSIGNVVVLRKPVLYEYGTEIRRGTFVVEVW
jgi:hypothetical protein